MLVKRKFAYKLLRDLSYTKQVLEEGKTLSDDPDGEANLTILGMELRICL